MAKKIHHVSATYCDNWKPKGHSFNWTKEWKHVFVGMKAMMIQDALTVYP